MTGSTELKEPRVINMWLFPPDKCPMCEQVRDLSHSVGWFEGPTRKAIGGEIAGMPVCQPCHDGFYDTRTEPQQGE